VVSEAQRQQTLLDALRSPGGDPGLAIYCANAAGAAKRALAAAYPTVQQLVGEETFGAISHALWLQHAPVRGDLATWGDTLPGWLADAEDLAGEPYLADVARVDWALHRAQTAADASWDPAALHRLAEPDAERLKLVLVPGAALLPSAYPVAAIWQAHRSSADDAFSGVREALIEGVGETAFVWRRGWRGDVVALTPPEAQFHRALLHGEPLAAALDAAPGLDFQAWLPRALRMQWLAAITD
jgi:Putative DNA-binding domain